MKITRIELVPNQNCDLAKCASFNLPVNGNQLEADGRLVKPMIIELTRGPTENEIQADEIANTARVNKKRERGDLDLEDRKYCKHLDA